MDRNLSGGKPLSGDLGSRAQQFIIVDLSINETLQTGAVGNRTYRAWGKYSAYALRLETAPTGGESYNRATTRVAPTGTRLRVGQDARSTGLRGSCWGCVGSFVHWFIELMNTFLNHGLSGRRSGHGLWSDSYGDDIALDIGVGKPSL